MAFFVDYDGYLCQHFYVNLGNWGHVFLYHFQLFVNILRQKCVLCTKYWFCNFTCKTNMAGKFCLLPLLFLYNLTISHFHFLDLPSPAALPSKQSRSTAAAQYKQSSYTDSLELTAKEQGRYQQ